MRRWTTVCRCLLRLDSHPSLVLILLRLYVIRLLATAGGLDGWGWREFKAVSVPRFDELALILTRVEEDGV